MGKTVPTSSAVWLIPDKLCFLQLQVGVCCERKKREGISVEEQAASAADYFMLAERAQALALTRPILQWRCSGVRRVLLSRSCKWMFIEQQCSGRRCIFITLKESDFILINKQTVYPAPAGPVFLFAEQSPLGWRRHTHTKPGRSYVM